MLAISFLGAFAYLGLVAVFAAGLSLAVIVLAWMRRRTRWSFAILLPAVWLTLEWVQAQGDLRMTAQHLGQSLGTVPFLVQFADLAGPYGVGLVLLLSNALLYEAWRADSRARRARRLAGVGLARRSPFWPTTRGRGRIRRRHQARFESPSSSRTFRSRSRWIPPTTSGKTGCWPS